MADTILNNQAGAMGTYNGQSLSLSSNTVSVTMVSGLSLTMSADQAMWIDGYLTYTVVLANTGGSYPYVGPIVTSVIDPTLVTLVADSVELDSVALVLDTDYTFDDLTGTLTVNFDDVAISNSSTLTFQVEQIA